MTRCRNINRPRKRWSAAELDIIRARYPNEDTAALAAELGVRITQMHDKAFAIGVRKSQEFISALLKKAAATVLAAGANHRFNSSRPPWNKGLRFQAGGRSAETQFQPKSLPHNTRPLGSTRLCDGFVQKKMTETGYPPRDWVLVHHLVWKEAGRGDIPKDHALCFRDGNRFNFDLDNLELITRAELMRRNSYHNYGPEIAKLIQLRGVLKRKINAMERAT